MTEPAPDLKDLDFFISLLSGSIWSREAVLGFAVIELGLFDAITDLFDLCIDWLLSWAH